MVRGRIQREHRSSNCLTSLVFENLLPMNSLFRPLASGYDRPNLTDETLVVSGSYFIVRQKSPRLFA